MFYCHHWLSANLPVSIPLPSGRALHHGAYVGFVFVRAAFLVPPFITVADPDTCRLLASNAIAGANGCLAVEAALFFDKGYE